MAAASNITNATCIMDGRASVDLQISIPPNFSDDETRDCFWQRSGAGSFQSRKNRTYCAVRRHGRLDAKKGAEGTIDYM